MTFQEKYEFLKKSIPVPALWIDNCENCQYINDLGKAKKCKYCFSSGSLVDCIFVSDSILGNKLIDYESITGSEKCYQCINSNKCYDSSYFMNCNSCSNCLFSAFLISSTDCFGCVALTHMKYCIFNKQYSKEEYP